MSPWEPFQENYARFGLASTSADFTSTVSRGDVIVVGDEWFTVATTGAFDATSVPMSAAYKGATVTGLSVYKGAADTGTHLLSYQPNVRGTYLLDVEAVAVSEIQQVTTSVEAGEVLSGKFNLTVPALGTARAIQFDASNTDVETAFAHGGMPSVTVTRQDCAAPSATCTWMVTFTGGLGDHGAMVAGTGSLIGNAADVTVTELTSGSTKLDIVGSPFTVVVHTADADAAYTTAFGRGLYDGQAGETAQFAIQAKDAHGNDRTDDQEHTVYRVVAFVPSEAPEDSTQVAGAVEYLGGGAYNVEYVPTTYGVHTVAVLQQTVAEHQRLTVDFSSSRSGTYTLGLDAEVSAPLSWDASAADVEAAVSLLGYGAVSVSRNYDADASGDAYVTSSDSYIYDITFASHVGDVAALTIDDALLSSTASLTEEAKGEFAQIGRAHV